MAIIPATKNFDVVKKSDFPLRLTFKDSTGSAMSLNGYTVSAQVWDVSRKVKLYVAGETAISYMEMCLVYQFSIVL